MATIKCIHCDSPVRIAQKEMVEGAICSFCKQKIAALEIVLSIKGNLTSGAQAAVIHSQYIGQRTPYLLNNMAKIYLSMTYLAKEEQERKEKHRKFWDLFHRVLFYSRFLFYKIRFVFSYSSYNYMLISNYQASLVNANYGIISQILQKLDSEPGALAEIKEEWQRDVERFETTQKETEKATNERV